MNRFGLRAILACCVIAVLTGTYAEIVHRRVPVPDVACITMGNQPYVASMLVVGESWAAPEHIFPSLPSAIASRLDGASVKVCTMAFNGETSGSIYRGLQVEIARGTIAKLFHGRRPELVLVLNGINDEIRHVGSGTYARNTAHIVSLFPASITQVVTAPATHFQYRNVSPMLRLLVHVPQYLNDHGTRDPAVQYRAALEVTHPEIKVVPFDEFMPAYDPSRYAPDGIHLTSDEFHRYSNFLAEHAWMPLPGTPLRQHQ